jgi:hypothetical protein
MPGAGGISARRSGNEPGAGAAACGDAERDRTSVPRGRPAVCGRRAIQSASRRLCMQRQRTAPRPPPIVRAGDGEVTSAAGPQISRTTGAYAP